jgi:2-methylisocitrate lyase-like PEP mutase family enzyme
MTRIGRIYETAHAPPSASPPPAKRRDGWTCRSSSPAVAENHIRGDDLDDTIARLQAYERAGADVLYAPRPANRTGDQRVCDATTKPVNVLAHRGLTWPRSSTPAASGCSVGGAPTWIAVNAMVAAAERMRDDGDFSSLAG